MIVWPWKAETRLSRADRDRSWALVRSIGLPVDEAMPLLEPIIAPVELEAVLDRIFVLHAVSAVAHGFSGERAWAWLRQEALEAKVTAGERQVLDDDGGAREAYKEQVEGLWALYWVAGLTPGPLDPLVPCPDDFVQGLPDLRVDPMPPSQEWRNRARRQTLSDLIKVLDETTCLAHAFDIAKAEGRPTPQLRGGEWVRHRSNALTWAARSAAWSEPVAVHPKWWGAKGERSAKRRG